MRAFEVLADLDGERVRILDFGVAKLAEPSFDEQVGRFDVAWTTTASCATASASASRCSRRRTSEAGMGPRARHEDSGSSSRRSVTI